MTAKVKSKHHLKGDTQQSYPANGYTSSVNIILLIAIEIFIVLISNSKLAGEDDLFWYLSTGRYIVQTGSIPSADVFGFTTAGIPWIPVEWGWDIINYYVHSAGGYLGLHILSTCIILLIFNLLLYNLVKLKTNYTVLSIVIVLLSLGISTRLSVKPHLVSYLSIALLLTVIIRYRYLNRDGYKALYFLPVIFLVWINMHMGVLTGLLLLSLYFVSELGGSFFAQKLSTSPVRPLSKKELIRLGMVIFLCASVTLLNPQAIKTYQFVFSVVSLKQLESIYEWMPPFSEMNLFTFTNFIYYTFIAGLIAVFIYSRKSKDIAPIIVCAGFFLYSLSAIRTTIDFMLVSSVFTAFSLSYLLKKEQSEKLMRIEIINKYVIAVVIILLIVMLPGNYLYKMTGQARTFGYGIDENNFPVKMFEFIKKNNIAEIGEKPFNSYETGGFFAWNFPGKRGFIGSRTINDKVWNEFTSILNIQPGFEKTVNETGFDYFMWMVPFLNYSQNPALLDNGLLSYLFRNNEEWKLVFWNDNSFLFVKNEAKFRNIIAENEYKYLTPFNFYFNREYLNKGIREEKSTTENELTRRQSQDPDGRFTRALINYVKNFK